MKNTLLSMIFISGLSTAQVTTFPWTETFETDSPTAASWTKIYESGNKEWTNVQTSYYGYSTGPYAGSYMAEFDITSFSNDTTKYVSPVLNLSGVTNPTLQFYYRNKDWSGDQNELKIYYRTSSSGPWTMITNFNTSISDWVTSGVLPLPSPSATYQIALEGVARYGCSLNVDNVMVSGTTLATSEVGLQENIVKVFPNPASDIVYISSKKRISEVSVFDLSGKQIHYVKLDNTEAVIPVNHLPSGAYIIQIKNTDGILSTEKFIKK
ncbi:Por secretion system C-terminal sorting domain-containing protein [Chryseobacterium sp. RU37D]|uniref:T9SS-dependent choice-of-anchor J family protein n=1 Tax=Chryseobacterium sp. RU37D TaxID=1907397 RepID=UPI0009555E80|nr:T9SS type A sorting domain-containing protein [Chryseobacterium sp. RU37D]SIQ09851.1 Por secretion system C-terminal sorting domain-containing protein [Chryseobacterium sp. RU37D]